jgi:transposase
MSGNKRNFSRDFKIKVTQEVESGIKSRAEATREYELSEGLLGKWLQAYRANPSEAFRGSGNGSGDNTIRRLEARISQLEGALGRKTYENEILKQTIERLNLKRGLCTR